MVRSPRGDEVLALANEDCLSASIAFRVPTADSETLDRFRRVRTIHSAELNHLSLVQTPAYNSARVLAVRATPHLDHWRRDPIMQWASHYCSAAATWLRQRDQTRRR